MTRTEQTQSKISLLQLAYKGLDDDELEEIATLTRFRDYPAGHVLCHEGEYEQVIYIIADGSVVISLNLGEEEGERILRVGGKGDVIGEMGLIQKAPRSATVRTTTPCTMLEMVEDDFEAILSRSPRLTIDLMRITIERLRENDQVAIADLRKSNKVLRLMDRNKMEFIQVTAHELRTPLTVLKGYANMLQSFPDIKANPAMDEVLEGIDKGVNRMHDVVNLMLDITRIDAEILKVGSVPVPVKQIVGDVAQSLIQAATERKIEITVKHNEETPNINADSNLIEKALYQLIVNAIKYTPDGGQVLINTSPIMMEDDRPGVEISVRDSGIGLDTEHHELIFEKFYQVGSVAVHSSGKTSFKGGGPGLGLAIVQGVILAHGGKVWVESNGHDEMVFPGSTFYLQLPINPQR